LIFPEDYKYVGTATEARPGDPIYFSTKYLIHFADEITIYAVEVDAGGGVHATRQVNGALRQGG